MKTVQEAIADFLSYVSNGWQVELAIECSHDTVYDLISLKDFATFALNAVGRIK